uniref:Uncharacterized protein n=1 Tax=Strigamia maritima TaxID=126957 RepID=T1J9X8_STRMM
MKTYLLLSFVLLSLILIQDSVGSKIKEKTETYRRRDMSCYQSCQFEATHGKVLVKAKDKENNRCGCKFEVVSNPGYNTGLNTGYNTGHNTGYNTGHNTGYNTGHNTGYNSNPGYNTGYNSNPGYNTAGYNSNPGYNTAGYNSNPGYNTAGYNSNPGYNSGYNAKQHYG